MTLRLHFFDVGHGDSILIKTPLNKVAIIDSNKYKGYIPALIYLQKHKIRELAFICLTHPHSDHFRGLLEIISYIEKHSGNIDLFADCGFTQKELRPSFRSKDEEDYYYKLYRLVYTLFKGKLKSCYATTKIYKENQLLIRSLAPDASEARELIGKLTRGKLSLEELNRFSVVLHISYGRANILLLADAEIKEQQSLLKYRSLREATDVFKISHHGSELSHNNNVFEKFRRQTSSIAIISSGCRYRTPSFSVIQNLSYFAINTYATNCFQFPKRVTKFKDTPSMQSDFKVVSFETKSVERYSARRPYHGNIEVTVEKSGEIKVRTQSRRKPIKVTARNNS